MSASVRRLALVALVALVCAAAARAQNAETPEQIMWSADSWSRSGDTYTIRGLTIEGGDLRIEAERAVTMSLEFNSRWELTGSIRMSVGSAQLLAGSARFEFESGELRSGELQGEPATFEETAPPPGQPRPIRAEASRILYDRESGTVQMRGSTRFIYGQSSMSGCDFLYDLDRGPLSGSNECGEELSITYVPPAEEEEAESGSRSGERPPGAAQDETPPAP